MSSERIPKIASLSFEYMIYDILTTKVVWHCTSGDNMIIHDDDGGGGCGCGGVVTSWFGRTLLCFSKVGVILVKLLVNE